MTTGLAAVVTIFTQLPASVACLVVLVIPVGTFIVLRQIGTQKGIRVELMDTKADMDGAMVELPGRYRNDPRPGQRAGRKARASRRVPSSCAKRRCAITGPWPSMTA